LTIHLTTLYTTTTLSKEIMDNHRSR